MKPRVNSVPNWRILNKILNEKKTKWKDKHIDQSHYEYEKHLSKFWKMQKQYLVKYLNWIFWGPHRRELNPTWYPHLPCHAPPHFYKIMHTETHIPKIIQHNNKNIKMYTLLTKIMWEWYVVTQIYQKNSTENKTYIHLWWNAYL